MSFIVEAAEEQGAPVIIACLPKVIDAIGIEKLGAVAKVVMEKSSVPTVSYTHLDVYKRQFLDKGYCFGCPKSSVF